MEIKTTEEYVLNELYNTREELALAKKHIEELEEKLEARTIEETPIEELPKQKTYIVSEQPNYYYYYNYCRQYDINTLLKKNNKTPEFLRQVLESEEAYIEYCGLQASQNYSSYVGGEIVQRTYDMLIVNYYNKISVIYTDYAKCNEMRNIDDCDYFLDDTKAKQALKAKVYETINDYFRLKYDEKFEPEVKASE